MGKNDFEQQILDKIKSSVESINLFLEVYDKDDNIDLYIYDLIAYVLSSPVNQLGKIECDEIIENYILSLIHKKDASDEISISYSEFNKLLKVIDNCNLSEKTVNELKELFIYKEVLIYYDYQLNLEKSSMKKNPKLKEEYIFAKNKITEILNKQKNRVLKNKPKTNKNVFDYMYVEFTKNMYVDKDKHHLTGKYIDKDNYFPKGWKKPSVKSDNYEKPIIIEKPKKR